MATSSAIVAPCDFPSDSLMDRRWVDAAYFRDSYRVAIRSVSATPIGIFHAVLTHHPWWIKAVLIIRNRLASSCGLAVPNSSDVMRPAIKQSYRVGETIGVWPVFALSESELVAGRDNKHLDFRLSVLKETTGATPSAVISTVCVVHNVFGRIYLFFIVPFHKWGVRWLIARAVARGRL
jgi:hypothetical protein